MPLHWTNDLAVSIGPIDEQHKRLFLEVDKLVSAANRKDLAVVSATLDFLAGYAVEHFSTEEKLMRESNYPGLQKHVGQHQAFVKDFIALKATYERDGAMLSIVLRLNSWLFGWLWNHIRISDVEMGSYLHRRASTSAHAAPAVH